MSTRRSFHRLVALALGVLTLVYAPDVSRATGERVETYVRRIIDEP